MLYKRILIYLLGFIMIAFSISLHFKHGFGNGAIDNLNYVISKWANIEVGYVTMIVCMTFVLAYFIKKRNKDIFISIIAVLTLGFLINFFNDIIFAKILTYDNTSLVVKIIEFGMALNIASIGIVLILKTKLSMMALEQGVIVLNEFKPFKKLNFGQARIVFDIILIILALIIDIFILKDFKFKAYIGTLILVGVSGPFINLYFMFYNKLFEGGKNDVQS